MESPPPLFGCAFSTGEVAGTLVTTFEEDLVLDILSSFISSLSSPSSVLRLHNNKLNVFRSLTFCFVEIEDPSVSLT